MESIVSWGSINKATVIFCLECLISSQNLCVHHVGTILSHVPFIYFCSLVKFCALNAVISLSDWTPNEELFGIYKSPVYRKYPPYISLIVYKPAKKCLRACIGQGLYSGINLY